MVHRPCRPPCPFPAVAAAALLIGSALGAAAQDLQGDMSGSVDGVAQEWHLLAVDGDNPSNWSELGGMAQVQIIGFPRHDSVSDVTGALEISLSLMGSQVADATIVYYGDGVRGLYLPDHDAMVDVSLSEVRIEGETLHLSGSIEAEVFRMVSMATEELDPDDAHSIAARFELSLPQASW